MRRAYHGGQNARDWRRQVAALAKRQRRDAPGIDPSSSDFARELASSVVTRQNNGLSWLFGNGLRYLRGSDVEHIAEDLAVPEREFQRVVQLKAFADATPPNPFFDTDGYSEFRGSAGGKISSWVSNYWKRVRELATWHSAPPRFFI